MSEHKDFTHNFFRTTGVKDFKVSSETPPPAGYPEQLSSDEYSKTSFSDSYTQRRACFIEHVLGSRSSETVKGLFYELIRMKEAPSSVYYAKIYSSIDYIDQRRDCADFVMSGILRMLYQLSSSPAMNQELQQAAESAVLNFKYWPDEPGTDSMCYWTENHHILFSVNEYLAGKLFPDRVFRNSGHTGHEKMERSRSRIMKWLELRFRTGFIEWLSNVYYDEDLTALLNLVDFSGDIDLETKGSMIVDLLLYDMAVNSFYGQFVSTHGRTYTKEKQSALSESTIDTSKLIFGTGRFSNEDNMSAAVFALSIKYSLPPVIYEIANDLNKKEMINKQRCSFRFENASYFGYSRPNLETAMVLLSAGGYSHPKTINHMIRLLDAYGWWQNQFFLEFQPFRKIISLGKYIGLTKLFAFVFRKDLSRNTMTEVNIYTYRTPDFLLSTAQNYRKGYGGDQHHIWQATLGIDAVCFTTHPGGYGDSAPDAYWHGSGYLPKAVQHRNVAIIQYKIPRSPTILLSKTLQFTHAWFPEDKFDEVQTAGKWYFARKDDAYLALYSEQKAERAEAGDYAGRELIAEGTKNTWICELGSRDRNGSFTDFIRTISKAEIKIRGMNGIYRSPSNGIFSFGWNKPFRLSGTVIETSDYKRYENPYSSVDYPAETIGLKAHDNRLFLDFSKNLRKY